MTLTGRRALVTAGSNGIGAAVAASLRAAGATVFITGTGPHVRETAQRLGAVGGAVADFARPGSADEAVRSALEAMCGVDILVANTGGVRAARATQLTAADWDYAYQMILSSAITLTDAVLPGMLAANWGRLVYLTSVGVVRPLPRLHTSNVMRAGVAALARSLAGEVAPQGVTTHVIAPAHVDTDRRRALVEATATASGNSIEETERHQLATELPVGRWGRPEEIGELVVYLCSDLAGFQTGATHVVDGGMTSI